MADAEVGAVEAVGLLAVDGPGVVAHHRPLLEPCPPRTLERHAAPVPVAQVVHLKNYHKGFTSIGYHENRLHAGHCMVIVPFFNSGI